MGPMTEKATTFLISASVTISKAFDRAAMSIVYGEEAANYYKEPYTLWCAICDWCSGFIEGMRM